MVLTIDKFLIELHLYKLSNRKVMYVIRFHTIKVY